MADIVMTQVRGTTHHYFASIDVDPANLEPEVDLFNFLDADGDPGETVAAILEDPFLEDIIAGKFEAKTTSVTAAVRPASSTACTAS